MKKILLILLLLLSIDMIAQEYTINIVFNDNEHSQRHNSQIDEIGEYFFITQKKCYDQPVYEFSINEDGKLNKGIIADNSYPNNVRHTFVVKTDSSDIKKIQKLKFGLPKNTLTVKDIALSEYTRTDSILKNAKSIYVLTDDVSNAECWIRYKVSKYY